MEEKKVSNIALPLHCLAVVYGYWLLAEVATRHYQG